jgi:hypothetical protein
MDNRCEVISAWNKQGCFVYRNPVGWIADDVLISLCQQGWQSWLACHELVPALGK